MQLDVPPIPKEQLVPPRFLEAALAIDGSPTAAELAERLGVEPSTVSRWRTSTAPLSRARWLAICAVLGLSIDWKPSPKATVKKAKRGRGRPRGSTTKRKPDA